MPSNKKKKGSYRDYQKWYQKGVELFDQGLFAEALIQWKKIPKDSADIRLFHRIAEAYFRIGIDRQRNGDFKGAIHYFYQATHYDPDQVGYHYHLGLAAHRNGEFFRAASSYREAQRLDQEDHRYKHHHALALLELGEIQEALDIIQKNIRGTKRSSDRPFWERGLIYTFLRTGKELEGVALLEELDRYPSQGSDHWLFSGMCYLLIEDLSQAAHCFERLAQLDTQKVKDSGAFFYCLGVLNLRDQGLDPALEMWEKAHSKGVIPAAQVLKGGYELKSRELFSNDTPLEAMSCIQALLDLAPRDKIAKKIMLYFQWQRGNSYAFEEKFVLAIQEWQEALRYQKNNAPVIHNIAIAYERIGDLEKANEYWNRTIQNWKANTNNESNVSRDGLKLAYAHLAENYQKMNQWDRAISELKASLKLNPNDLSVLKDLGRLFFDVGEEEKALSLFKKVYTLNPQDCDTTNWLARIYEVVGLFPEAIKYLERSLAIDKGNYFARTLLPRILILETEKHLARRRYEEALGLVLKAISWDLQDYHLYNHLGNIYLFLQKKKEASDAFQKALELDPSEPMVPLMIGKVYLSHKIKDTAQGYFKKAIEISSEDQLLQILKEIAFAYLVSQNLELGKKHLDNLFNRVLADDSDWMEICEEILEYEYPELAIEYLEKAIKLYPQESRFYFLLSWAYDILGEESKGGYYLDQAIKRAKAGEDQELLEEIEAYLDFQEFSNYSEDVFL